MCVNVVYCWEQCVHDQLNCFNHNLKGFLDLYCAAAIPECNTPCEDGLHGTPIETGGDCSGHIGYSQTPKELKMFVGLFNGSNHVLCPCEISTDG